MFYSHQKKTLSPSIYSHQNNFHFLSAGTRSAWCWCWPPPPCPLLSSPLSLILHHQRQLHFIGLPLCLKDLLGLNTKSNITHFTCYHSSPLLNSLQSKYSVVKHFPFLVSVFLSHFIIRHILFDIFRGSHVFFLAGHLKAIYLIDQPLIQQLLFVDFLISQNLRETPEIFIISSLIFILSSLFSANIVHLRISYLYLLFLHCSHLLEFSSLSLAWRHFPSVWQNFPPLWYHFYCLNISYHLNNCLRWSKCKEPTKNRQHVSELWSFHHHKTFRVNEGKIFQASSMFDTKCVHYIHRKCVFKIGMNVSIIIYKLFFSNNLPILHQAFLSCIDNFCCSFYMKIPHVVNAPIIMIEYSSKVLKLLLCPIVCYSVIRCWSYKKYRLLIVPNRVPYTGSIRDFYIVATTLLHHWSLITPPQEAGCRLWFCLRVHFQRCRTLNGMLSVFVYV